MDMICPTGPQGFYGEQTGLLTALVIGGVFGFALERAGFGNARKLAAQFYLYDMTVFKVMFTAILVAMTGLYAFSALGWADLSLVWINPTYLWPQLAAGFLLGVGFIVSGLCPGTAFVSLVSGKGDALAAIAGVFVGVLLFSVVLDGVPALGSLFHAGTGERLLLQDLVGLPAPWLALGVVLMALGAFLGAEKVEAIFTRRYREARAPIEDSRVGDRRGKFYLAGVLALVCIAAGLGGGTGTGASADMAQLAPGSRQPLPLVSPMELAERLIQRDPDLLVLDLRKEIPEDLRIPGAVPVAEYHAGSAGSTGLEDAAENTADVSPRTESAAQAESPAATSPAVVAATAAETATSTETAADPVPPQLAAADMQTLVLLITESGLPTELPAAWPVEPSYAWLQGGMEAWKAEILTPAEPVLFTAEELESVRRRNQLAAYFSGVETSSTVAAPPPPIPAGGKKKKKAEGGC